MARSGSIEGRSGRVISPAPSCLREVREVEWLPRREPADPRASGDDPVPVVIADGVERLLCDPRELVPWTGRRADSAEAAAGLFSSA